MSDIDYTINVEQPNININIDDIQDFTIEVNQEPDYVIELNKQGPPGAKGEDGSYVVRVEPILQEGYDVTYRMFFSDDTYYDFVVTNGTGSLIWKEIKEEYWESYSDIYRYTIGGSYSIVGVYKGTISSRTLVTNIDVSVEDGITYIYSPEIFSGYALSGYIDSSQEGGTYIYEQGTVAISWVIEHNLNTYPSVTVVDTANNVIIPDIKYNSPNKITLTFRANTKGKAYLNYTR